MLALTEAEHESLQHLRQRHDRWRVARWMVIGYGIGLCVLGGFVAVRAVRTIDSAARAPSDFAIPIASMLTVQLTLAVIMFIVGGGIVVWVTVRWRGNPVHQLLVKLFEAEAGE